MIKTATAQWSERAPGFYLEQARKRDKVVRQFALPHVYYVGSHEGCGCGFIKEGEEGPEFEIHQANYLALTGLIREAMARGASIELFACWEGDQAGRPESVESLPPSRLEDPGFQFKEKQFIRVNVEDA